MALDLRKKQMDNMPPFWQNGMPVAYSSGIDQIDPMLRNSAKNGNIPSSLLQDLTENNGVINMKSRRMISQGQ